MSNSSIWHYQGPGSDVCERALGSLQSITEASPLDCFESYLGRSLWESNLFAEMKSVYLAAPGDWAILFTLPVC